MKQDQSDIKDEFYKFIGNVNFPCVIANSLARKEAVSVLIAGSLGCPADDRKILRFVYEFVGNYRKQPNSFQSLAIIFNDRSEMDEDLFEKILWQRLNALQQLDAINFQHDERVNNDPSSPEYSFSLMEEAFFILALHRKSSRPARRFNYPTLVFNPHAQFEKMKQTGAYEKTKAIVRKRDEHFSGSINPMLADFGSLSEARQYSGKSYDASWECPLHTQKKQ